jgi:hypothetical protein
VTSSTSFTKKISTRLLRDHWPPTAKLQPCRSGPDSKCSRGHDSNALAVATLIFSRSLVHPRGSSRQSSRRSSFFPPRSWPASARLEQTAGRGPCVPAHSVCMSSQKWRLCLTRASGRESVANLQRHRSLYSIVLQQLARGRADGPDGFLRRGRRRFWWITKDCCCWTTVEGGLLSLEPPGRGPGWRHAKPVRSLLLLALPDRVRRKLSKTRTSPSSLDSLHAVHIRVCRRDATGTVNL